MAVKQEGTKVLARLSSGSGQLDASVGFLLAKAAQRMYALHLPLFENAGVSAKQFGILSVLLSQGLSQIEVGRMLLIDRSTMVNLIDELEQKGFVERKRDQRDRRAYVVLITAQGRNAQEALAVEIASSEQACFAHMPSADMACLKRVLQEYISS